MIFDNNCQRIVTLNDIIYVLTCWIKAMKLKTYHLLVELKMNIAEAVALLTATTEQAQKAQAEIVLKISELQASISELTANMESATLSAEQAAAVDAVVVAVQALDDIVPDVPVAVDPVV
jgi:chromosome segregation ATPase